MPSLHHLRRRIVSGSTFALLCLLAVGNVWASQRIRRTPSSSQQPSGPVFRSVMRTAPRGEAHVSRAASAPVALPVVRVERLQSSERIHDRPPRATFRSLTTERTELLRVESAPRGPSSSHPDALVYVPAGLDRDGPLSVVVFFHGWHGCASVVAGPRPERCSADGHRRVPLDLVRQFRDAHYRGLLIVPQLGFDDTSTDPGTFRNDGAFRRFLDEVLVQMSPLIGRHRIADLSRVMLASHSAGFMTLLQVLEHGGVPIDQVALFDSMYRGRERFVQWIVSHARRFRSTATPMRFVCVYQDASIASEARQMVRQLTKFFPARARREQLLLRDSVARLEPIEARRALVFARVPGDHAGTARANFGAVLRGAGM